MSKLLIRSLLLLLPLVSGCASIGYYWQTVNGHLKIINEAKPIETVINNNKQMGKKANQHLINQLVLATQIRQFAISALALPDNGSYTHYVDINRPYPVWIVSVAPVDALELKDWCYFFLFCLSYKGYYAYDQAVAEADLWRNENFDVAVSGVPAYSTLGFTKDPILSSFIQYPAGELARLIFHELAHQVVYVKDDTEFNESFATTVEELGLALWFDQTDNHVFKSKYEEYAQKRKQLFELLMQTRDHLVVAYADERSRNDKVARKAEIFQEAKIKYSELKAQAWNGWSGYDRYFNDSLNNARMALLGVYNNQVAGFRALFKQCQNSFPHYYEAVAALAKNDKTARDHFLQQLAQGDAKTLDLGCRQ